MPGRPSDGQRRLYKLAWEQIHTNIALIKPGLSYRELAETAWQLPASCTGQRYSVVVHGVGLCDEYPAIRYREDYDSYGYDGVFEPGMVICVEVYCGRKNGREGVKLEDQVLITENGFENLISYVTFMDIAFMALAGFSVILFRRRLPDAKRPYRTWGYPVVPLLFVIISAAFLLNTLIEQYKQAIAGLMVMGIGIVVYWLVRSREKV